ncbi:MAG: SDR family oxidoreductase [Planctomycetia bacterium]|nr:SDR family oxidoreductase [Planctomycetia bacterium]
MSNSRVVLITGTRKGIGRFLAQRFSECGDVVVGCSRSPVDFHLDNYEHHCFSVTDERGVKQLFETVRQRFGRVDVLINNAGIASMNHAMLTPLETVENVLATNVVGTFLFCREAARLMRKAGQGRIVNFSSIATHLNLEGEAIYAASKAAVESLTRVLARELATFGITVNAVGPTPIETDLIKNVGEERIQALVDRQAIKRLGRFEDVFNVIDFFVRPESDFVTGQVVYLGGP